MLEAGLPVRPVTGALPWRGVPKEGVVFDRDWPHGAAVTRSAWRGCVAWPIGLVCPDSGRAHDASRLPSCPGRPGRPQPAEDRTRLAWAARPPLVRSEGATEGGSEARV